MCDFAQSSHICDLMHTISSFVFPFLYFSLNQIFGAIESDDAIGFPVGGSSQNINVSEGTKYTTQNYRVLLKV